MTVMYIFVSCTQMCGFQPFAGVKGDIITSRFDLNATHFKQDCIEFAAHLLKTLITPTCVYNTHDISYLYEI